MSLELFLRYKTPRQTTEFLEKFWQRRYENLENYLDKLFQLDFGLEEIY